MSNSAIQEVVCGLGYPVAGNPMQLLMERALVDRDLDWRFLTFEVAPERLADAVRGLDALGVRGISVMAPHQLAVLPLLDRVEPAAELMGSVNCVYRDEGALVGANTDGLGFLASLQPKFEIPDKRVMILGAGGVARSIAVQLAEQQPAELLIVNRTPQRGKELVEILSQRLQRPARQIPWGEQIVVPETVDLLINATTLGWCDPETPFPIQLESLRDNLLVADVNFNPAVTWLLDHAQSRGCPILTGVEMLVEQAALALERWMQTEVDRQVIREAAEEYLEV